MGKIVVDIIIPVYNTDPRLLEKCIKSVLSQSYKHINITIIDDGSTSQGTLHMLDRYRNYANIIKQRNNGVSSARNRGLDESRGDYVFFLDSDDYMEHDYIQNMLKKAESTKTQLVFSGRYDESTNTLDSPFRNHIISFKKDSDVIVIKSSAFTSNAVLISGEIARSIRFNDNRSMGEDTEYIIKAMAKGDSYYWGAGGLFYSNNRGSVTKDKSIGSIKKYLDESFLLLDLFRRLLSPSDDAINTFSYIKITHAYCRMTGLASRKEAKRIVKKYTKRYDLARPKFLYVLKSSQLMLKQKIRIIMISMGLFGAVFYCNKITAAINRRKHM